jgi:hypothetical protein
MNGFAGRLDSSGRIVMPNLPVALGEDAQAPRLDAEADRLSWLEVALTVVLTSAAVLVVSFLSVVTNF